MTARERIENAGYEKVIIFDEPSYDDALIGVTDNNQAVYDYYKMIMWLMDVEEMSMDDAIDFISYNSSFYYGEDYPIIIYPV